MVLNLRSWPDSHGDSTDDPTPPGLSGLRLQSSSNGGWTQRRLGRGGEMISMRELPTSHRSGDANGSKSGIGAPLDEMTIQVQIDRQRSSRAATSPRRARHPHEHHVVIETETIVIAEDSGDGDGELTDHDHDKSSQFSINSSDDDLGKYGFGPSAGGQEDRRRSIAFAPTDPSTYRARDTDRAREDRKYGR